MPRLSVPLSNAQTEEIRALAFQHNTSRGQAAALVIEKELARRRAALKAAPKLKAR